MDDDTLSSSPPGTDGETDDFIEADIENPSNPVPNELTIPSNTTVNVTKKKKKWAVLRKAVTWSPFVQVYRKKYPWVQLAGHQGNFSPGEENGTIIKKSSCDEAKALSLLMNDALRPFVPEYRRDFVKNSECIYYL
jgi:1D-myo-inositol-triphosphate 3-kinase